MKIGDMQRQLNDAKEHYKLDDDTDFVVKVDIGGIYYPLVIDKHETTIEGLSELVLWIDPDSVADFVKERITLR
ncbi:hypothetical protein HGI30_15070 [Paenibacillus albicereus]|uniref:Uncharacterized protein n=1 Tax=Paenibacillus albicereus TaxID=2726185 RepID=A0A6H2GZ91_9BACL|nr:hypothetical protein [Paenibacillus albicereus]QJC52754.1 hypothetical protein HGI30_15070 [Paenibacillus albicereus]